MWMVCIEWDIISLVIRLLMKLLSGVIDICVRVVFSLIRLL